MINSSENCDEKPQYQSFTFGRHVPYRSSLVPCSIDLQTLSSHHNLCSTTVQRCWRDESVCRSVVHMETLSSHQHLCSTTEQRCWHLCSTTEPQSKDVDQMMFAGLWSIDIETLSSHLHLCSTTEQRCWSDESVCRSMD